MGEIGKGIRRTFSSDYHKYQSQLKQADKTVPKGAPSITRSAKTPVGPNKYEAMTPKEQKGASPDYPVRYQVPMDSKEHGIFKKTSRFEPSGAKASFTTGPGLLPPEHRVPGRFDYSTIPDVTVTPRRDERFKQGGKVPFSAKGGVPADPETGLPKLPTLKGGGYKVQATYPRTQPPAEIPSTRNRRGSLDSLDFP